MTTTLNTKEALKEKKRHKKRHKKGNKKKNNQHKTEPGNPMISMARTHGHMQANNSIKMKNGTALVLQAPILETHSMAGETTTKAATTPSRVLAFPGSNVGKTKTVAD